ncbi:MAG TPA: flagellar biosynthesis protein FlgE [Coprothermobacter sp.]|nr:flagellar biosynthesis protein FlgE [Coprothermobacter sp.]
MVELYGIARAGMRLSVDYINVAAFNISNVNTEAFKALEPVESSGNSHEFPVADGRASILDNAYFFTINRTDLGALNSTSGYALINPRAYFVISDGVNQWLTRKGNFELDQDGNVTLEGLHVMNRDGAVAKASDIYSGNLLFVEADTSQYDRDSVGFIPSGQERVMNLEEAGFVSGVLETSNVDLATEMVKLIAAQRAYQFSAKAFRNADELVEASMNIKGA